MGHYADPGPKVLGVGLPITIACFAQSGKS